MPDREEHLVDFMTRNRYEVDGKYTYQYAKLCAALVFVKQWRTAVDVGAHVGLWSMHLAKRFRGVIAFEPISEHCECWYKNVTANNAALLHYALGKNEHQAVARFEAGSTGDTYLMSGDGIAVRPLDSFNCGDVDFIKIDVEGYEMFVVQGGERTIRDNRPVMIVEQKPKGKAERQGQSRFAAIELLQRWGAQVRKEMSGDYILVWP